MSTASNPRIGLDNVVIAKLTSDSDTGVVYDTPIAIKGAVQASVNPNSDVAVDYADNTAFFVTNNRANTEISLEFTNIDPATLALMLGQSRVNGITVETPQDQAPYFALGFRVWIGGLDADGNKIYQLFWYAKGKFSVPESGGDTKKESMDFQHTSLTAQFVSTQYSPNGDGVGVLCTHCRTDIDTASATASAWFNQPVLTASASLSAVTVAIAESDGSIVITGTKGSGESFNFAADSIVLGETLIVLDSDGEAVAGTVTVGSAGTAPTITFTPTETTTFGIVTVTSGVKDIYGVGVTPKSVSLV